MSNDQQDQQQDRLRFGICGKCGKEGVFLYQSKNWACGYCS